MKKLLIALFASLILSTIAPAQNVLDGIYLKSEKELTTDIDKSKQEIVDYINHYRKIEKSKSASGYENFFIDNEELKLVVIKSIDNDIEKRVSWYFKSGRLIFAEQIWIDNKTNTLVNHEKFYEDMGHIKIWVRTDNTIADVNSDDFKNIEKEMLAYAEKLKLEAKK